MEDHKTETKNNLVRADGVISRIGVSKATFYRFQQKGLFPRPAKQGNMSFWTESDIDTFIERMLKSRPQ